MLLKPATERAMAEHWGHREFFDTLIVRDVPGDFPAMAAAMMSYAVAQRHRCGTIIVEQGSYRREFSIDTIKHAMASNHFPQRPEMGIAWPEDREARHQNWPVTASLVSERDSLPKGD